MNYFTADAEMASAREILFHCRGKLSAEIRKEASRNQSDAQRLTNLELVMSQLRDEIDAVTTGDRAVTTRVRLLYGMLIKDACAPGVVNNESDYSPFSIVRHGFGGNDCSLWRLLRNCGIAPKWGIHCTDPGDRIRLGFRLLFCPSQI